MTDYNLLGEFASLTANLSETKKTELMDLVRDFVKKAMQERDADFGDKARAERERINAIIADFEVKIHEIFGVEPPEHLKSFYQDKNPKE